MLDRIYFGNSVEQWLISAAAVIVMFMIVRWVFRFMARRLSKVAKRTETVVDDMIVDLLRGTRWYVVLAWCFVVGLQGLKVVPAVPEFGRPILIAISLLQVGIWGNLVITYWIKHTIAMRLEHDASSATTMTGVRFLSKIVLWTTLTLVALDNLGIDITALVAGLGIGGIAVALALQTVLGDLLASLSIVLDKPFQIGDFIVLGEFKGSVEHVGLKTTRIRSLSGEQVIISNADLLKSRIRNFKRMSERRVVFTFGVTYQTPAAKLKKIPAIVRSIIDAQPLTRFDRSHFHRYGDSALEFETVYYVVSDDYNQYMDIQHEINLAIHRTFAKEKVEFAFPTRTVHLVS